MSVSSYNPYCCSGSTVDASSVISTPSPPSLRAIGPRSASSQRGRRQRGSEQDQRRRFRNGRVFDLFWKDQLHGGEPLKSLGRHDEWL